MVETAISGIVVAGITASVMLAVRYSQMVSQGKAVGQQLTTISEGAARYMRQYNKQILALDARCAESTLEIDEGGTTPPPGASDTGPDCKLVLGSVTVANGFQPTVRELQDLELVRANDALLLPFSPGIAVDKRSGEAALARIAVAIRPVRHEQSAVDPATTGGTTGGTGAGTGAVIPAGFVPGINDSLGGPIAEFKGFPFRVGTDAARDMPPTINGVSCYNGKSDPPTLVMADRLIVDSKNELKLIQGYTDTFLSAAVSSFQNGRTYCRYLQQRYGMGLIGGSGTTPGGGTPGSPDTGGTPGNAWTLESVVFNTQPYYFGSTSLPLGAAAQMGAALQEAGYAGRMSMLKSGLAESKTLRGVFGHSQSENPIQSKDGARGLPGILAAVNLLADSTAASAGSGSGSGSGIPSWDAAGNDITNAGLIQGQQIATNSAVIGGAGKVLQTKGRSAVLAVNGNLVMGQSSTLMAAAVEAARINVEQSQATNVFSEALNARSFRTTPAYTTVGKAGVPHSLIIDNGTQVRLPRVQIGAFCSSFGDIGVTQAVSIQTPSGNSHVMTRFIAVCQPDITQTRSISSPDTVVSKWSSADYDALLLKFPTKTYTWNWFPATAADTYKSLPADAAYPEVPNPILGTETAPPLGQ
ncbi:hypothetical protein CDN98_02680 [Roseateles terrae]|nr:hypothetical protein CDN98_02680 [Roseateles terrae]